jgi:hypothetical protein
MVDQVLGRPGVLTPMVDQALGRPGVLLSQTPMVDQALGRPGVLTPMVDQVLGQLGVLLSQTPMVGQVLTVFCLWPMYTFQLGHVHLYKTSCSHLLHSYTAEYSPHSGSLYGS